MKTARELLIYLYGSQGEVIDNADDQIEAIRKYARDIAHNTLLLAADNARAKEDYHRGRYGTPYVDRDSILRTKILTP